MTIYPAAKAMIISTAATVMLNTSLKFPFINVSLACVSPDFIFTSSSFAWAGLRRGRSLVLTPHISTLYPAIIPP